MKNQEKVLEAVAPECKGGRRTLYQRLHLISLRGGVILALCMVLASVPLGNWRVLSQKVGAAERVWNGQRPGDLSMAEVMTGRVADAANLLTIMKKFPDAMQAERNALESASQKMREAQSMSQIAQATTTLEQGIQKGALALYEQPEITQEQKRLVQQVTDSSNNHTMQQVILKRDYNRVMQEALDTYNELPARMLLTKPELFGE